MFKMQVIVRRVLLLFGAIGLSGCAAWWQTENTVLVRQATDSHYEPERSPIDTAQRHYPYAVLSANVYERTHGDFVAASALNELQHPECDKVKWPVGMPGWHRWPNFPSEADQVTLHAANMHVEVWESLEPSPQVVMVFEGTVATSLDHWKSNLRWLLRFLPGHEDHYTLASRLIAKSFHGALMAGERPYKYDPQTRSMVMADGRPVRLYATGHSLGGGLAQQFAYAFYQADSPPQGIKVDAVYAFDPSPVTGWFSTPEALRDYNAKGLKVERVFEHGEILAYLRLFTSNLVLSEENPAVSVYRYNFRKRANVVESHSMKELACELFKTSGALGG